ncbi:hypothetical protein P879_09087 [Paragonimus westermani]|uniref:Uncharacterized protein n=1 Tax=Paragonimus westermani TaxID=34504 RepID=A0A8T0DNC6_9TREM|nr:hypothetical protein P879_09087 [Paragonimus westermani]
MEDILGLPGSFKLWKQLEETIIRRIVFIDLQLVAQPLNTSELDGHKSSQFLRRMLHFAGFTQLEQSSPKEMWFQRLPNDVYNIFSANFRAAVSQLAETTDRLWET